MSSDLSTILFDFDGVIVNSEPLHCRAFQIVLAEIGVELTDRQYYAELIGFDDRGAFDHIFRKLGKPTTGAAWEHVLRRKADTVQSLINEGACEALPGVDEFVRGIAPHYPLAICSGALRAELVRMLDGTGLREFFPIITAAEDVPVGKPNPMGYLQTVQKLSDRIGRPLSPGQCLVIEDAPTVIRTTKAAGFRTLGVATSHGIGDLDEADYAVDQLSSDRVRPLITDLRFGEVV